MCPSADGASRIAYLCLMAPSDHAYATVPDGSAMPACPAMGSTRLAGADAGSVSAVAACPAMGPGLAA